MPVHSLVPRDGPLYDRVGPHLHFVSGHHSDGRPTGQGPSVGSSERTSARLVELDRLQDQVPDRRKRGPQCWMEENVRSSVGWDAPPATLSMQPCGTAILTFSPQQLRTCHSVHAGVSLHFSWSHDSSSGDWSRPRTRSMMMSQLEKACFLRGGGGRRKLQPSKHMCGECRLVPPISWSSLAPSKQRSQPSGSTTVDADDDNANVARGLCVVRPLVL